MIDDLTAAQAAKIRDDYLERGNAESQKILLSALKVIHAAAERGETQTGMDLDVMRQHRKAVIGQLEKRGFKVKVSSDQRDGDFATVSW